MASPFDLTLAFGPGPSAADALRGLADAAEKHGVDFQETYGSTKPGCVSWLEDFQSRVASELGKQAAVFLPSGTMAQQIVLCMAQRVRRPCLRGVQNPSIAHNQTHQRRSH